MRPTTSSGDSSTYFTKWREMLMQVILSRLRFVKAIISSAEYFCCTGKVVLIKILWVLGMASSIF